MLRIATNAQMKKVATNVIQVDQMIDEIDAINNYFCGLSQSVSHIIHNIKIIIPYEFLA